MRLVTLVVASLCLAPLARAARFPAAQSRYPALRAQMRTGEVLEDVTSVYNPAQSYALYIPSGYRTDREWPIVFLMDPRGRARVPIDSFQDVAERRGFILMSSYNTASDTREDVNTPALRAMLLDANQLFRLDQRRFYLAGFSGTARVAWLFAAELAQSVDGIIGFGGGLPQNYRLPKKTSYAFYGAAGTTDFNFEEMMVLDGELDEHAIDHRVEFFPGEHQWGPPEVCTRAVEWMELRAVKTGLVESNADRVADIYRRRLAEAEGADGPFESFLRYRSMVEDFQGLVDSDAIHRLGDKVSELEDRDEVRDKLKERKRLLNQYERYRKRFGRFVYSVASGESSLALPEMIRDLDLHTLKKQAEDASDPMKAQAAQRTLEMVHVQTAFYLPRDYLDKGDATRAIALLEVADFVKPGNYTNLVFFARAYAEKGDAAKAVEYLARADAIRPLEADFLANDPYLAPIRDKEEFQELLRRVRSR